MTRLTIDELEILTPDQLWMLFRFEIRKNPQYYPLDSQYIQDFFTVGHSIDYRDEWGYTALHWAAYYGNDKFIELLLKNGIQMDVINDDAQTALDLAEDEKTRELFLRFKAK